MNFKTSRNVIITSIITVILIISGFGVAYADPSLWIQNGNNVYYNNGNVGIGISTPSEKLEIQNGNIKITNDNLASDAGASVINFGGQDSTVSYGQIINSTKPITYKGTWIGVDAKTSSTSSVQNGAAHGRLASSGAWHAGGSFIGVTGISTPNYLRTYDSTLTDNGLGGFFRATPDDTLDLGPVTGTAWIGGVLGKVSGTINNNPQSGGAVAGVIGIDDNEGTADSHAAYFYSDDNPNIVIEDQNKGQFLFGVDSTGGYYSPNTQAGDAVIQKLGGGNLHLNIPTTGGTGSQGIFLGSNDGIALSVLDNGKVGVGITNPNNLLSVNGAIESTSGGFVFPDGTTQSTANNAIGDITGVTAGTGLSGGGNSGSVTLNIDTSIIQNRVTGSCSVGSSISMINSDGSVTCETDSGITTEADPIFDSSIASGITSTDITSWDDDWVDDADADPTNELQDWSTLPNIPADIADGDDVGLGDITNVITGSGLTGGGTTGDVTLTVDTGIIQNRVTGTCTAGTSISKINDDGTVQCATDDVGIITETDPTFNLSPASSITINDIDNWNYIQLDTSSGEPPTQDCNDMNKLGLMKIDNSGLLMYVCGYDGESFTWMIINGESVITSPTVTPVIQSLVISDPEGGDLVYSVGDILVIQFDSDTNTPTCLNPCSTDVVNSMFRFSEPLGYAYQGVWSEPDTFTITIYSIDGGMPIIGRTTVTPTEIIPILSADGTSIASNSTSPVLLGGF